MGNIIKHNQPCLDVERCGSSDAMQIYEDGGAKCYSCGRSFAKAVVSAGRLYATPSLSRPAQAPTKFTRDYIKDLPHRGFPERDITREVCEFYGVRCVMQGDNITHHVYPYGKEASYKIRICDPKSFYWVSTKSRMLFGQDKFEKGGRRVVLVEGETDALAMQQANLDHSGKMFPVVGLTSSADLEAVIEQREWLRSFTEVVVFMDNDEAGQKALKQILRIIGYDKCRVMDIAENDINDQLLQKDGAKSLIAAMFNAQERSPAGVVGRDAVRKAIIERANTPSHPYAACLGDLNKKIKGKRGGEIVLFISGTGCGKSTMFREEILNVLATSCDKVGVVSLEEAVGETGQKLAAMNMNKNPADDTIPLADLLVSFDKIFTQDVNGEERIMLLDHQGAITDNTIMDQLEYMCLKGCKYIFIDHITIMVSEGVDGLTGNEAQDKVMNDLLRIVKRYPDVWIGLISHLRKASNQGRSFESGRMPSIDDIRGSGSIKQISFDIVAFSRDTTSEDPVVRNTVDYMVLKCRWNGDTGPAGSSNFNSSTGRMSPSSGFVATMQPIKVTNATF
jgi:twinkle protein